MRRLLYLAAASTVAVACAVDLADDGEPRRGGGWDANSGNWNGNMGTWGTIAGIGGNPTWAPGGTGPSTLTNWDVVGLRWTAAQNTTACGPLTAGVDQVRFLSSSGDATASIGPDVELERAGVRERMTMGETVSFHAQVFDGTMASIRATITLRRVDTLAHDAAPSAKWPVFELTLCEHARPDRGFAHLGYVSWGPMMVLPESESGSFVFPPDLVQPLTTLPRAEYRDNPAVPSVVTHQTGALMFKFAFYASIPVALGATTALDLRTSRGDTLANHDVLVRGAIALGNGGWVHMPTDGARHKFLSFFTRTGTPASMFAIGRGNGGGPAALLLPMGWGDRIGALELTAAELVPSAADSLDSIHAIGPATLEAGDVWAHGPTELGHGLSSQRHGYYLGGSGNNNRNAFFAQLVASTTRARWSGLIIGRVASQGQLAQLMSLPSMGPRALVAAESPPPDGKPAFESPALRPMPPDSPVFAPPVPIDAGIDATTDAITIDAPIDAAAADAPTDAASIDAPAIDAPPVDAPAIDAPPVDAPAIDAGVDAPIDAPTDAAEADAAAIDAPAIDAPPPPDAGVDAPPTDAMCKAAGCDDAM